MASLSSTWSISCSCPLQSTDECPASTYCGPFCCPDTTILEETWCCENSDDFCCVPPSNRTNQSQPTVECGTMTCPTRLPASEVYDENNNLRNQCCIYFRGGCCSRDENDTLDLLYVSSLQREEVTVHCNNNIAKGNLLASWSSEASSFLYYSGLPSNPDTLGTSQSVVMIRGVASFQG